MYDFSAQVQHIFPGKRLSKSHQRRDAQNDGRGRRVGHEASRNNAIAAEEQNDACLRAAILHKNGAGELAIDFLPQFGIFEI